MCACSQLFETEAIHFKEALEARLKQFSLEVASEKTKLFEFGIFAQSKAKARGERPATFYFLGFMRYNSRSRDGKQYRMKRKAVGKRLIAKVVAYKEWLKANRDSVYSTRALFMIVFINFIQKNLSY